MQFFSKAFDFKRQELILIFVIFYVAIFYMTNKFITNEAFYYSAFGNQLSAERIGKIVGVREKLMWIYYILIPLFVVLKLYVIASIIYTGGFLLNLKLSFQNSLKIVLLAELITIAEVLARTAYFLFYPPVSVNDLSKFHPFSISQIINISHFPGYLLYPVQLCNLFEVAYWVVLAFGIMHFIKTNFKKSFAFVACTYGIGLVIWVLVVMFIQVQYS